MWMMRPLLMGLPALRLMVAAVCTDARVPVMVGLWEVEVWLM